MDSHRERELKFDVDEGFALPAVDDFAGPLTRVERRTVRIVSTYYDTQDRALLAGGVTVRRREGEVDAGWQLKVPTKTARTEISMPPQAGVEVPERLRALLAGALRGRELLPVAQVRTERVQHRLLENHRLQLEVADDRVQGTAFGAQATITSWREVEAEVGPAGDEKMLQRAAEQLTSAGATPSGAGSKLAKTLGAPASATPCDATSAVRDYAQQQWKAIVAGDITLRRGLDSVHKTRVAVRRFRSMLRVLGPLLDRECAAELDAELSWYQNLLGDVRDRQVQRARLGERLAALAPQDVLGPVSAYIEQSLLGEQAKHREEVAQALDSGRYLALLDRVAEWAAEPPVSAELTKQGLRRLARKAAGTARKRLATALDVDEPALLHRARKAAKRARYATELAAPVTGKSSKRRIKEFKRAQDVLGEHQDSIIAAHLLHRLGTASETTARQTGFTVGMLYLIEQDAARQARADAARLKL